MKKHTLTDSQWECIKDMLPFNGRRGNQWKDHRMVINGILWILKNGAPWRSLPPKYGHWKTVFKRFRLWTRQGLWDRILERLQFDFQSRGKIDWRMFSIDGSNIRAHKSAAGAKKTDCPGETRDHVLGYSRGGYGTKIHLICDSRGFPLSVGVRVEASVMRVSILSFWLEV